MLTGPMKRLKNTIEQCAKFAEFRSPKLDTHKVVHYQAIGRNRDGREEESLADVKATRPFILICPDYKNGIATNRDSNDNFVSSGILTINIEKDVADVTTATTDDAALFAWAEVVEEFVKSVLAESTATTDGSTLRIESLTIQRIGRSADGDRNTMGDYFGADLMIHWGATA